MSLFNSRPPQPLFSLDEWTWPKIRQILGLSLLLAFALGMMFFGHMWLHRDSGLGYWFSLFTVAVLTLIGATQGRYGLVLGIACFCFILKIEPVLGAYWIATGSLLYLITHWGGPWKTVLFWCFWTGLGLFLPKLLFQNFQSESEHWKWINQAAMAGFLLRYVWYFYESQKGAWPRPAWFEHLSYVCFIPQICQALNYAPSQHWKLGPALPNSIYQSYEPLALAVLKIALLKSLLGLKLAPAQEFSLHAGTAWFQCAVVYLMAYLALSSWYDLAVGLARLFGMNLPCAFRYPLLATSPIEFWRRFSIFNRRFIVELVYKPLGGSRTAPVRNTYLAFLAAAFLFGVGWIGSVHWLPVPSTLVSWVLFMLIQATSVVLNHKWRSRLALDSRHSSLGWKAVPGWILTQAILVWSIPLVASSLGTPGIADLPLSERLIVLLTTLGLRKPLL
jgi:D-alanyl-lipoteichoic acid acyltransferase DltB (MBOAT superfamily)